MPGLESKPESGAGPYKGFHTSINSTFTDPNSIRIDCCSLSCCGILQSDYNRFLLHRKLPSTWKNRSVQHLLIPLVFFFSAGYAAVFIPQPKVNQIACTSLLFMSVCWIIGGCMQATHKRALARRDLLRTVRHGRDIYTDSIDGTEVEQTEGNMVCAHRLCGFYPSDDKFDGDDEEPPQQRENRQDMCSCLSRMFSDACCGKLFSCQWQIFGVCALAQEGRELDRMIPMHERRFDYVTFQPYVEYFNAIRKLRKEKNESLWSHYMALSKLSRVLLKTLFTAIGVLMVVAFVIKPSIFQWGNLLVFVATFLQAFLVLYFVHWHWNKFDISLDAIIKYFACGFVITTTTALFFEMVDILFLDLLARALMSLLPVEVENDDGYGSTMDPSFFNFSPHNMYTEAVSDEYKKAFLRKYPYIFILYIFVSAYLVAAFVEELCKYFGFKIVEHPDFLTESDLRKAAAYGVPENKHRMNSERDEWGGGLDCIGDLDCVQSDSNLSGGIYDSDEENDNGQGQRSSKKDVLTRSNSGAQRSSKKDLLLPSNNGAQRSSRKDLLSPSNSGAQGMPSYVAVELTDAPPRGIQSIASAITIAMVAVSLGFACCENLIYIFLYNGKEGLSMEIAVLVSRSLIPVHPLCAAIQSIGVCRQLLENDKSIGLFRILFPAILLHGSYDFSLMLIPFLQALDPNAEDTVIYNLLALTVPVGSVILGVLYYVVQSNNQIRRLGQIETARSFVGLRS